MVTTEKSLRWDAGSWQLGAGFSSLPNGERFKVVAYDFGAKRNILRMLVDRGCELTVVPAKPPPVKYSPSTPMVCFFSNGPGDPAPCDYAISAIKAILEANVPVFGICLGHQLLALASGAKTLKMKFGHHGGNHPVQDLKPAKVLITSQNHGFAVDEAKPARQPGGHP